MRLQSGKAVIWRWNCMNLTFCSNYGWSQQCYFLPVFVSWRWKLLVQILVKLQSSFAFIFKVKTVEISLFWCRPNSRMDGRRTMNCNMHVYIDRRTRAVKFPQIFLIHKKKNSNLRNCIVFPQYKLPLERFLTKYFRLLVFNWWLCGLGPTAIKMEEKQRRVPV